MMSGSDTAASTQANCYRNKMAKESSSQLRVKVRLADARLLYIQELILEEQPKTRVRSVTDRSGEAWFSVVI